MTTLSTFDKVTDQIEGHVKTAYEWTKTHQALVRLGVGSVILFWSPRLSCTLLLFNCVRGVGLPLLQKSFGELYASYRQAKQCIKDEAPALETATAHLQSVTKEVKELEAIIVEMRAMTTPDVEKIKANVEKAKADIARLSAVNTEVLDVGRRISSKFDYAAAKQTLHQLYLVTLSAVASAQSETIAKCSIGVSLGATVTKQLQALVKTYEQSITAAAKKIDDRLEADDKNISAQIAGALLEPDKVVGQLNSVAFWVGNTVGLTVGLYATAWSRLIAASHLGAEMVLVALEELADPLLPPVYSVKGNHAHLASLLSGLAIVYNVYAFIPGSGGYGPVADVALAPLLVVEQLARSLVAYKI